MQGARADRGQAFDPLALAPPAFQDRRGFQLDRLFSGAVTSAGVNRACFV
jgi:hypothetical protein